MSDIKFSAELDTKKLDEAIKQSDKTVKDWVEGVEKSSQKADQGFSKVTKTLKEAIAEQKTLIKSIEQDVKSLEKAYSDPTAGRAKLAAGNELKSAKRALAEEQGTLIGLQKQQIEGNRLVEKSSDGVIGKIGRMAMAYVSVSVVVKALKETVLAFFTKSEEGMDLLERKVNGLKASLGVLQGEFIKLGKSMVGERGDEATPWGTRIVQGIKILLTTANFIPGVTKYFDDLADKMNKAGEAAERYTLINQELKDAERAMIVPRAQANAEIVKARLLYADDTNSTKVRIAALEKALKLEDETARKEIEHQQWVILNIRDRNIMLEEQGKLTDENRKELEEAIAREIDLQRESNQRQVRATNSLNAARKEAHDEEMKRLKELQKELDKLAKAIEETDPGKGYSILNRFLKHKGITPATGGELTTRRREELPLAAGSAEWYKKMQKAIAENDKEQIELLQKQLDLRNEIVHAAASLVYQIGQQIGLDEKSMHLLGAGLDAFTAIATQGVAGLPQAALSMLSAIIAQTPSSASRFEAQIERINDLLIKQARLVELSEQRGGQEQARRDELENLKQLKAALELRKKALEHKTSGFWGFLGIGAEELKDVNAELKETNNLIEDANEAMREFYTDTTAASIADAIAQGFQDGKTSAADFADTFNDFMIQAINSALLEMSKPDWDAWRTKFAAYLASDGILTKEEIESLRVGFNEIIARQKAEREAMAEVTGLNLSPASTSYKGLTGIVRNMTEETGNELSGLFRRFADEQRVVKDYSIMGVNHLVGIEKNTAETVTQLQLAVVELKSIVSNTKQVPAGSL